MSNFALHGFLGKPADWNDIFKKNNVYTIDLYKEPIVSLDDWAIHFNAHASTHKGPRTLIGYSMGGRLALHALIQQPSLWNAAIIISAHPGLISTADISQRLAADETWAKRFETDPWDHLMFDWNSQSVFQKDQFNFERNANDYSRSALAASLRSWSLGRQANLLDQINQLEMPILWIAGECDNKYAALTKKLALSHPLSEVWIAPKTGHRVPWRCPEEFIVKINQFYNTIGVPSI